MGGNLVDELNSKGEDAILIVDNLSGGENPHKKFVNLSGAPFVDYMDSKELLCFRLRHAIPFVYASSAACGRGLG